MDPLSILASSITLLGATISASEVVVSAIAHIKNHEAELDAARNDVTEFRAVLVDLDEHIRLEEQLVQFLPSDSHGNFRAILGEVQVMAVDTQLGLQRSRLKLLEIEECVRKLGTRAFIARLRVLEKKKLASLRQSLRDIKLSLSAQFSVKSGRLSLQSLLSLHQISRFLVQASQDSSRHGEILAEIQQLVRLSHDPEDERWRTDRLIEAINSNGRNELHLHPLNIEEGQRLSDDTGSRSTITAAHRVAYDPPDGRLVATEELVNRPIVHTNHEAERGNSHQSNAYYSSVFKLDISRHKKFSCQLTCNCHCHRRQRRRVNSIVGGFAFGLSNFPLTAKPCLEGCTSTTPFSATLTYRLPAWFFFRIISLVFITSIFGDPWIGLKIRPMTKAFSIFRLAAAGDIPGLRKLFERKEAHPSSSFWGGWTALHYAISNGQASVCKLLLNQKADPSIEDGANSLSALEWAWIKILGRAFPPAQLQEFETIFADRGCLEEFGFPRLHRLVLKIENGDLASEIQLQDRQAVNAVDFSGRTALSWAAQRGDAEALQLLLEAGADTNITTRTGMAPLHYAAEALEPVCVVPLLQHGAYVGVADHANHTALHLAAKHRTDTVVLEALIESGIDVNARTDYDFTPLVCAIYKNHVAGAKYLIESGADFNVHAQYGKTPVMYAIEYNAHDSLQLLLEKGADCALETDEGQTIAHFAASFADSVTLDILLNAELPLFSLDSLSLEDREGLIIDERLCKRLNDGECNQEFLEAFQRFMHKITDPNEVLSSSQIVGNVNILEQADDSDAFVDAQEHFG